MCRNTAQDDAKEHIFAEADGDPTLGCRVGCRGSEKENMTLGNGYLGSRIDEERSEMRYVV